MHNKVAAQHLFSTILLLFVTISVASAANIQYITLSFITNYESGTCYDADGFLVPCGNETTMQVAFLSDVSGVYTLKVEIPEKNLKFEKQVDVVDGWNYLTIGELGVPGVGECTYDVSLWDGNTLLGQSEIKDRCYTYLRQRKWEKVTFVQVPMQFTFGEIRTNKILVNGTAPSIGLGDTLWLYIKNLTSGEWLRQIESCDFYPNCTNRSCQGLLQQDTTSLIFENVIKPLYQNYGCSGSQWCWYVWGAQSVCEGSTCTPNVTWCPFSSAGICLLPLNEGYYYEENGKWTWPVWMSSESTYNFPQSGCGNQTCGNIARNYSLYGGCKDNQRCEYQTWRVYRYHYNWTISYNAMITVENRSEMVVVPIGYNQTTTLGEATGDLCSGDKVCFTKISICGDGVCDVEAGERCWNCPDCACASDETCIHCEDDYTGLVDEKGCMKRKAGIEEKCVPCVDNECGTYNGIELVCVTEEFTDENSGMPGGSPPTSQPIQPQPYGRCCPKGYWWDPYHNESEFGTIGDESISGMCRPPRDVRIECPNAWSNDAWWACGCVGKLREAGAECTVSNFGNFPEDIEFTLNWKEASLWSVLGCIGSSTSKTFDVTLQPGETKRYIFKMWCGGPGYCQLAQYPMWVSCNDGTDMSIIPIVTTGSPLSSYPAYIVGEEVWKKDWGACGCDVELIS